ncbi:hypothetical protein QCD60_19210 [Pokkaliibacter sp. MBI-7]|uniref:hypothetical protein n=1 Tax=Pokkaliibacter sp. MBI-7 TaxID=3040600 RepID=UPI002446F37F|nr:hypothetical protein [Pokkaliibacter sp. MBI-7]MDH2434678.1 hypothetical protein [Pokkaliibacter sp. MBI-7]
MTVIALLLRSWQWLDSRATRALLHHQLAHLSPHLLRDLGLQQDNSSALQPHCHRVDQLAAPSHYRLTTFSQRITDYDR